MSACGIAAPQPVASEEGAWRKTQRKSGTPFSGFVLRGSIPRRHAPSFQTAHHTIAKKPLATDHRFSKFTKKPCS